jgi:hypothetical protein
MGQRIPSENLHLSRETWLDLALVDLFGPG